MRRLSHVLVNGAAVASCDTPMWAVEGKSVTTVEGLGTPESPHPLQRARPFPNGATAMGALARSTEAGLIGCTQITEIKYTEGVSLVGLLPKEFELATVYSAAVCSRSAQPENAAALVKLLSGSRSAALRAAGGFEF